ncbi:uncharacterized protein IWZ02DRAFT_96315 [Phyllosticta citriasiana]|uniref:Secreted protein n=1 Tax=Phyllosticta citriasiana TaxID=595635 RepID=A0ABR1KI92_9PEZI
MSEVARATTSGCCLFILFTCSGKGSSTINPPRPPTIPFSAAHFHEPRMTDFEAIFSTRRLLGSCTALQTHVGHAVSTHDFQTFRHDLTIAILCLSSKTNVGQSSPHQKSPHAATTTDAKHLAFDSQEGCSRGSVIIHCPPTIASRLFPIHSCFMPPVVFNQFAMKRTIIFSLFS